jgi:hypothetical protein
MSEYQTTAELASHFRTTPGTVRYWRYVGYGPKGIKVGRKVLYPVAEVERFEAELRAEQNGAPAA